jgi:hypothetical protein
VRRGNVNVFADDWRMDGTRSRDMTRRIMRRAVLLLHLPFVPRKWVCFKGKAIVCDSLCGPECVSRAHSVQ